MRSRFTPPKRQPPQALQSAPHLWQLGLASAEGRTYDSIAVVLTRTLGLKSLFATVGTVVGRELRMTPFDSAHVTLAGAEGASPTWAPADFAAGKADITAIDTTGYSIRLVPEQGPFKLIAAQFGLPAPERPYGITLCYALASIDAARTAEIVGAFDLALRERSPLTVSWEYVELQRRPLASREPFGYQRLAGKRGS